jgi:hypothetical protein
MSTSTGQGATVVQAPHLFTDTTSEPSNLLHHDTMSGYGFTTSSTTMTCRTAMMIVLTHEQRGKLAIGSTLGPFLSIFVHLDTITRHLPLHTIKGEGGTLNGEER